MNIVNKFKSLKKAASTLLLISFTTVSLSAQTNSIPSKLTSVLDNIEGIFGSSITRSILTIALGLLAIGLAINKDNEVVKKKFVSWIGALIILAALTEVVGFFWD